MAEHSTHSASGMYRWAACPGSINLCKTVPPSVSSKYAEEGTKAHDLAARVLELQAPPSDLHDYDQEMIDAVYEYVKVVRAYQAQDDECKWWVERRFDLSSVYPGCFGTSDFVLHQPKKKKLIVIDYKHGAGVWVSPKDNPQLLYYGLGAVVDLKLPDVETVELGICQPRCGDGEYRCVEISVLDLLDFKHELVAFAKATEPADAPLVSGDHCKWCPAKAIDPATNEVYCPKLREDRVAVLQMDFSPVPDMTIAPEALAKALASREVVKEWVKSVDEYAYAFMEKGGQIPGWKLVDKKANRKWTDAEKAKNMLKAAGYGEDKIMEPATLKSPAQVETAIGKKNIGVVSAFIEKKSSGHTIAPESDPRPAVKAAAFDDFEVVPEKIDVFA